MEHAELERFTRELPEAFKTQDDVNEGLVLQIETLVRLNQSLWNAVLTLAGHNPPLHLQELAEQARREMAELKNLARVPGQEPEAERLT
jgi:hypothetical protein